MKKDVNFILLGLLVLLVGSIAGLSVYYYDTYQNLNSEYLTALKKVENIRDKLNSTLAEVNVKEQELNEKEKILSDYIAKWNLSKERDFQWENIYSDVKGKKEELEQTLETTKKERDNWMLNYTLLKQDIGLCESNLKLKVRQLGDVNRTLTEFREDRKSVRSDIADVENRIDDMMNDIGDIKDDAKDLKNAFRGNKTMDEIKDDVEGYADHIYMKSNKLSDMIKDTNDIVSRIKSRIKET